MDYFKKPEEMGEFDVNIRFFGRFEIENRWGKIDKPRANRANSWLLLKYLLCNRGREVEQDELLDAVLPGGAASDTGSNARVRLVRARKALEPLQLNDVNNGLVLFSSGKYSINPAYNIYSDEEFFLDIKRRLKSVPAAEPMGAVLCCQAIEMFRGPYLDDSPTRPWIDKYRRTYAREFVSLAFDTLSRAEALDDARIVPLLCRRAVAIAPEAETLHNALINALMEQKEEVELLRYIFQLTRSDAEWIEKLQNG